MMEAGVPAGANKPCQELRSYPGKPASAIVGIFGARVERVAELTARAVNFP